MYLVKFGIVGLFRFGMAFKVGTIQHPNNFQPFKIRTCLVFKPPLYSQPCVNIQIGSASITFQIFAFASVTPEYRIHLNTGHFACLDFEWSISLDC